MIIRMLWGEEQEQDRSGDGSVAVFLLVERIQADLSNMMDWHRFVDNLRSSRYLKMIGLVRCTGVQQ